MENCKTPLIQQFYKIMEEYRDGKYGNEFLNIFEILSRAGEPDLLNNMSIEELTYLERTSSGETKQAFKNLKIRRRFIEMHSQETKSKHR